MNTNVNSDAEVFGAHYDRNVESIKHQGSLILAYDRVLNPEAIARLEAEIEQKILEKGLPKSVVKKVFFICIEALQNMFIHGFKDENDLRHNFFILYMTDKHVRMINANLIANSAIEKLSNHIQKVNSFSDPAELKQFYLQHLENNELSEKGGAGLGFITIGMKSGNKLETRFENINAIRSLFQMEVAINIE